MTKKLILSALAASALAFATLSYAAPGTAPSEPASATQVAAKIDMTAALKAAQEKFPEASALSASLHGTRGYGLVWDVRMEAKDGSMVRVFVSPEDGSIVASDNFGIRERAPRYERGAGYERGPGYGYGPRGGRGMNPDCPYYGEGPGYGPGCGMGMNPDCPYYGEGRPHHRGGWWHGRRHGGGCWF